MNEEIARKMMCAAEKPEGSTKKPPIEKPIKEAEKEVPMMPYPAMEPPGPWPGPKSPGSDKPGRR